MSPYLSGEALITFHLKLGTDPEDMLVTMGAAIAATPGSSSLGAIYDSFADAWIATLNESYIFRGIEVVGTNDTDDEYAVELFSNQAGESTEEVEPQNCALLITKATGVPGRGNKGRCYVPGVLSASSVEPNGNILPTPLGGYQTAATAWYDALTNTASTGVEFPLVLHNGDLEAEPPRVQRAGTPVSAFVVDDTIATQRRRLR